MGFINLIAADFHLHLRGGAVASWQSHRSGVDGAVELSAIGQDGNPLESSWSGRPQRSGSPDACSAGSRGIRTSTRNVDRLRRADVSSMSVSLMHEMATRQVVLLGETHTIAEIHRWQLHVATVLRFIRPDIAVGFEMFPRRVQPVLDEWVAGELSSRHFLEKVDWETNWGYDAQLYFPLFHFCRQQRVPMLALNCNRPLVTRVGKEGWDAIPEDERDGLSPVRRSDRGLSRISVRSGSRPVADRADVGDGSETRSIHSRPADLGSRLCLQHRAGDRSARPTIGDRHHRQGPSRIRTRYAVSTARSRYSVSRPCCFPRRASSTMRSQIDGIADAIFRLDEPEPAAPMPSRMQNAIDKRRQNPAEKSSN